MATPSNDDEPEYYTDIEVAHLLGLSLGRLRNKLTAGDPLPPRVQPPGCRSRLWPKAAFHDWLAQFLVPQIDHRLLKHHDAESLRQANRRHLNTLQQDIARLNITDSPLTQKLQAIRERAQRKRAKKGAEP